MSKEGRESAVVRLRHMLEAADAIIAYTARGRAAFESDSALRDAILYQIVVLGEAAKAALAADPSIEVSVPDVEWSPIARMRDRSHTITGRPTVRSFGKPPRPPCRHFERLSPQRSSI